MSSVIIETEAVIVVVNGFLYYLFLKLSLYNIFAEFLLVTEFELRRFGETTVLLNISAL